MSAGFRLESEDWMRDAACAKIELPRRSRMKDKDYVPPKDLFFPGPNESPNPAKMICIVECPVRAACDEYRTRTNSQYGVWAAKTQIEDEDETTI